jgi:hypothetical protein
MALPSASMHPHHTAHHTTARQCSFKGTCLDACSRDICRRLWISWARAAPAGPPTSGLLCMAELFTWLAPDTMLTSSWPPVVCSPEPTCCSLLVLLLTTLQVQQRPVSKHTWARGSYQGTGGSQGTRWAQVQGKFDCCG